MKQLVLRFAFCLLLLLNVAFTMQAVEYNQKNNLIVPVLVKAPVTIDGELTETVWQSPSIKRDFITTLPNYGDPLGRETEIWVAYDKKKLYFAFKCFDTEPQKIKTTISKRDDINRDDQVGIVLDATGNRQTAYMFYVNPNGIQADAVQSAVTVRGADYSPDFVWQSAGKLTADGYHVEVCIPLESIRYQAGQEVKMGISFIRRISHLGAEAAWPEVKAGQTLFNSMATVMYTGLKGALKLEILPNVTYSLNGNRETKDSWDNENEANFGVGMKYGLSSSMTLEATVNPDFSQVESDAFQVEINQRYPIFFSEKRPFFMESKDTLDFGVVKWGLMVAPVHTRTVVDPGWAVKFSGSAGKMNFAMLAANDRSAGYMVDGHVNPNEGKSALFGVFRAKYNIGSDNSVGILYSGRQFKGKQNHVVGADLKYRLSDHLRATVSFLQSFTRHSNGDPMEKRKALNGMLEYRTPTFFTLAAYERYDMDFHMETAFLTRDGVERWVIGAGPSFNMKAKALPWLKRVTPYGYFIRVHDLDTQMNDTSYLLGLALKFAPEGELIGEYYIEDEVWERRLFRKYYWYSEGLIQLFKWLYLNGMVISGDSVYYDGAPSFLGKSDTFRAGVTLQPNSKLNISLEYVFTDFRKDGGDVYSGSIYNLRGTYQFNRYFFLRGILRYDGFAKKLMTDVLASFTLIPGTVVHLGYGSLNLKGRWQGNSFSQGYGHYYTMKRGLFFKASYLWRLK